MSKSTVKLKPVVFLRALDVGDIDRTLAWHNNPELYRTLGDAFRFVSRTAEEEWLRRKSSFSSGEINLAICLEKTNQHVGNIYLREIDWIARHAVMHIFIGEPRWRHKGLGRAATECLLRHAFEDLNLRRVLLHVLADNSAALGLYRSLGFLVEGTLRQHAFKGGVFEDVIVMALLRDQ